MASIQAFRAIANNTSVSDSRYVYYANGIDNEGNQIDKGFELCFNAAGKPREFKKPSEAQRKEDWSSMRLQLREIVRDKLHSYSSTFKEIEEMLVGKIVNGDYDLKTTMKPLRKRDIVKVFTVMDKELNRLIDKPRLATVLFEESSQSLNSFLNDVRRGEYGCEDVELVPSGRMGEAQRVLADLVNKAMTMPLPLGDAEIAKLKKKFIADFKKKGFLNEESGCGKSIYEYMGKTMTGKAAVKRAMVNTFFDDCLATLYKSEINPEYVGSGPNAPARLTPQNWKLLEKRIDQMRDLTNIARIALGKHEGVGGGNGYMGVRSDWTVVKFLTHSKERKALAAAGINGVDPSLRSEVYQATKRLKDRLLEIAGDIDEDVKERVETILEGDIKRQRGSGNNGMTLLSRVAVAKAVDEISKSFVGPLNAKFSWDDVERASTISDTTLENIFPQNYR